MLGFEIPAGCPPTVWIVDVWNSVLPEMVMSLSTVTLLKPLRVPPGSMLAEPKRTITLSVQPPFEMFKVPARKEVSCMSTPRHSLEIERVSRT